MKCIYKITILIIAFSNQYLLQAQQSAFYHLSTAEGLSDNNVSWAARDRNGILWIGTTEGLNSFDGNRITTYYKQQYPELPDNNIARVLVDSRNRVWLRTASHFLTMLDEQRRFHKIQVGDSTDTTGITSIIDTKKHGLIALKGNRHYFQQAGDPVRFTYRELPFQELLAGTSGFNYYLHHDYAVYYRGSVLVVIDYNTLQLKLQHPFPGLAAVNIINNDELLLFTTRADVFYRFSISQKKVTREYRGISDQDQQPVTGDLRNVTRIDSNRFAFTTFFSGLYILDIQQNKLQHWMHDPLDIRSVGGNNTLNIKYDSSGYLFVTTQTSGLHFINLNQQQAFSRPYFKNETEQVFDGYIQSVATDGKNNVWMGAQDRLIRWDRNTGKSQFIPLYLDDGSSLSGRETIREADTDLNGDLWLGTTRYGVYVLDSNLVMRTRLTSSMPGNKKGIPSNLVNAICRDSNGDWWIGTSRGVCIVRKTSFEIIALNDHPLLAPLRGVNCTDLWKDADGDMWIGTLKGVWHYRVSANTLRNYSMKDGLPHNTVYAVNKDNLGNTYFATLGGLAILSRKGTITSYTRSNGLRNDRCEEVLKDNKGYMWIGNLNCIIRFDPATHTFTVFEDGIGFSHGGYRIRCGTVTAAGEMLWGTDKGIIYFFPEQMNNSAQSLHPFIHRLQAGQEPFYFTKQEKIGLPYNTSSFVFSFSSGELTGDNKNKFLYKLEGFDKEWQTPLHTGQAVYSKLPPGNYRFLVKASRDGMTWFEAPYAAELAIESPWWQQTWFRIISLVTALAMILFVIVYFQRRRKNKMAMLLLNTKMAETKFLNLRLQMNPHFLFNSLSAIQHLIVSQQTNRAYKYLTVFSNFLRSLLNFAEKNFIPLDEELKILGMYTELESLRFDDSFTWKITADETLSQDEVLVPSLMVQPFAENAIWHGLLHKDGKKELRIHFSGRSDDYLTCTIEDNGIGREKAAEIKNANMHSKTRQSRGIAIIQERLQLLQQKTGKPATVEITDLYDTNHEPAGTRVRIIIPYYNPEST